MVMKNGRGTHLSVIRIAHGDKAAIVIIDSIHHQNPAQSFGSLSSRNFSSRISTADSLLASGYHANVSIKAHSLCQRSTAPQRRKEKKGIPIDLSGFPLRLCGYVAMWLIHSNPSYFPYNASTRQDNERRRRRRSCNASSVRTSFLRPRRLSRPALRPRAIRPSRR